MSPDQQELLYWAKIRVLSQRIADAGDTLNTMSEELAGSTLEFFLMAFSADALGLSARLEAFRTQFQPEEESSEQRV